MGRLNTSMYKDIWMANKHIIKCSTPIIKEMLIKSTITYHHTPTKMAKIKKINKQHQILVKVWSNQNSHTFAGESKIVQPLWKTI